MFDWRLSFRGSSAGAARLFPDHLKGLGGLTTTFLGDSVKSRQRGGAADGLAAETWMSPRCAF